MLGALPLSDFQVCCSVNLTAEECPQAPIFWIARCRRSKKSELPKTAQLAKILGFVPKGLTYTLFAIPDAAKYHQFTIPKRSGGERSISAPNEHLKLLQRHLATRLYECVREIEEAQPNRKLITHGFQKGRSIITNADRHRNRRHIFNIDIQDFFGAINFGRVRGFFIKDRAFMLQNEVATTIAQIACWQNGLPQGAPCSPVISNLVAHILDVQLLRMAKECRARYTRYADDITFSTNEREFPTKLAVRDIERPSVWTASPELSATIRRAGFEINPRKNAHADISVSASRDRADSQ